MFTKSAIVKGTLFSFMMMALLSGCGNNVSEPPVTDIVSTNNVADTATLPDESKTVSSEKDDIDNLSEAETTNSSSEKTSDVLPAETATPSTALPEESEKAGNVKIYEGLYFDESYYQYVDMPQEESPLIYCEITISNVTDNAFDFVINEKVMATGETKVLVPANTAVISSEASKAVYQGENLTLTFVFPDDENTFPQHLEVSGLAQLENKVYMNNTIPGHESG